MTFLTPFVNLTGPMRAQRRVTCALVSGGLDSAILVSRLLRTGGSVFPLYVRCGFVWEAAELAWLRRFLRATRSSRLLPLRVVAIPLRSVYTTHWSLTGRGVPGARSADTAVYLPGRNVLLLSVAAIVAAQHGIATIALGVLAGNPFGDATPRFFRTLAQSLTRALDRPVRLEAPLRQMSKRSLIRSATTAPLGLTFSCLRPRGRQHCGRCNKCAERRSAFRQAGLADPTLYVHG